MPAGLLNENHEPTAYYGVERNFVETAIIPTTWREGGLQVVGTLRQRPHLADRRLPPSFDLTKWDATSDRGPRIAARLDPPGAAAREGARPRGCSARSTGAACRACCSAARVFTGRRARTARRPRVVARHAVGPARALDAGPLGPVGALRARHDLEHRGAERAAGRQSDARSRSASTAGTCRAPTGCGRAATTRSRRSCAGRVQHRALVRRSRPRPHAGAVADRARRHARRQFKVGAGGRAEGRLPAVPREQATRTASNLGLGWSF